MKKIACISPILLAVGCDLATTAEFDETPPETELSIAELKTLCDARVSVLVSRDATICGQVVANDLYGEFLHQIVIQDDSGGIAIAVDEERLYEEFPFGALVEVACNGLYLCDYGGKIELGDIPDQYGSGRLSPELADRHLRVVNRNSPMPRAARISFEEVSIRLVDTRIRFDGVQFANPDDNWCDRDPDTGRFLSSEREIIDSEGNRFLVRTLGGCSYAGEPLPEGTGSLFGVIDYFGGKFSLRVTFHEFLFDE